MPHPLGGSVPACSPPAEATRLPVRVSSLPVPVFFAAGALALCILAFGAWNMRRAADLSAQNTTLKEKRLELLGQIKQRNLEISELRYRLDSLMSGTGVAPVAGQNPVVRRHGFTAVPKIEGLPISFDNGTTSKRLVCLTFDGNDLANAAQDILDTLASRNVKATMFLTGRFILKHPDMVGRIIAGGHEVGSHTFSHPHLTSYAKDHTQTILPSVTEALLCEELAKTDSVFRSLAGRPLAPLWRAPYGESNPVICAWAQRAGFIQVGWRQGRTWKLGLDSNDWTPDDETPGYHTPREVYDKIVGLAQGPDPGICGGIILMHLGTARTQKNAQVHLIVGKLIDTLQLLGYRFVIVTEMLRESGVDIARLKHS